MSEAEKRGSLEFNTDEVTPRYSSISVYVTPELKNDFLLECKLAGLNANDPICLSLEKPSRIDILFETVNKKALIAGCKKVLKNMFLRDKYFKFKSSNGEKVIEIDIQNYSEEAVSQMIKECENFLASSDKNQVNQVDEQ